MGNADRGVMIRIDNVLAKIPEIHSNYIVLREALKQKLTDIEKEIKNSNNYSKEIETLTKTVSKCFRHFKRDRLIRKSVARGNNNAVIRQLVFSDNSVKCYLISSSLHSC